jgi:hypothetical protein
VISLHTQGKSLWVVNPVGVARGATAIRLVGSPWMDLRICRFDSYSLQSQSFFASLCDDSYSPGTHTRALIGVMHDFYMLLLWIY